jgi:hypothetical protein
LTGRGGSPAKGDQGTVPDRLRPYAEAARIGSAATEASRRRRLSAREVFSMIPSGLRMRDALRRPPPLPCALRYARETNRALPVVILVLVGGDPKSEFRCDQFTRCLMLQPRNQAGHLIVQVSDNERRNLGNYGFFAERGLRAGGSRFAGDNSPKGLIRMANNPNDQNNPSGQNNQQKRQDQPQPGQQSGQQQKQGGQDQGGQQGQSGQKPGGQGQQGSGQQNK